jgi:GAF domain-containing protein
MAASASLVLEDAREDDRYRHDPYVLRRQPRSILAAPLINQGRLLGVVYLENNLASGVFTPDRLSLIQLLASEAAIAVQNAQLYQSLRREIAERTRVEATLRTIAEDTAPLAGVEFFRAVTRHTALTLHTRYAFLAEVCRDRPDHVATLAFWVDGAFADNITYPLAGTPCESVVAGEICFHPEGVARLFPRDRDLATIGAESYLGVPLRNSGGRIVGHLAVIHDHPFTLEPATLAVLKIFATRAGAELERLAAEEAVRAALAEVERLKDRLQAENVYLQEEIKDHHGFEEIVGRSPALERALARVEQVAATDSTVLILGHVDLFATQLVDNILNTSAAHPNTRTDGINSWLRGRDGDLRALARLTRDALDLNGSVENLRHLTL